MHGGDSPRVCSYGRLLVMVILVVGLGIDRIALSSDTLSYLSCSFAR